MAKDTSGRRPEHTHLITRAAGPRGFNRGGLRHTPEPKAHDLKDIKADQLKAILAETMVISRFATAEEAEELPQARDELKDLTPEQTARLFMGMREQLIAQNARIESLENALRGDRPPKKIEDAPGRQAGRLPGT